MIQFAIPGHPPRKERPRVVRGHAFTPKATKDAEKVIALLARKEMREAGEKMDSTSRFRLTVSAHFKGRVAADWDNIGKIVSDALNGIVWKDDRQVDDARVFRFLSSGPQSTEYTVVSVERI